MIPIRLVKGAQLRADSGSCKTCTRTFWFGGVWSSPVEVVQACHAVIKARGDLAGDTPDQVIDFVDISYCVDAFRGDGYPFAGPTECPETP